LTKIKVVDRIKAQTIPLVVTGPRPPQLEKVRLEGDESNPQAASNQNTSFLRRYVSRMIPLPVRLNVIDEHRLCAVIVVPGHTNDHIHVC
jgi:hypothetical protein